MTGHEEPTARFFYGLQPRWTSGDRLYRVHVSSEMMAGASIAGQFYDEESAFHQLQHFSVFVLPLIRRGVARRWEREAFYDGIDPFGPALLEQDARNFQLRRSEVARTRFRKKRSLWTPLNVGVVVLECLDGTTRRFILVGDQEPDAVLELIQVFDPDVEVT